MDSPLAYIGEHLLIGQLGTAAISVIFATSILSALAYWRYHNTKKTLLVPQLRDWYTIGKWAYLIVLISAILAIGLLIYMIFKGYLEYQYVFNHASVDLPQRYILSALWAGQEGGIILWIFWNSLLGLILLRQKTNLTPIVLLTLSIFQVFLAASLIGVYFTWFSESLGIGSNPFILLRDALDSPLFNNASYVSMLNGTGLDPILQNDILSMHAPVLMLGYACASIPFCYALASLFNHDFTKWHKPALRWLLLSAGMIGFSMLTKALWTYRVLTIGSLWTWSPTENTTLALWIMLLASISAHRVALHTDRSIRLIYLLHCTCFSVLIYAGYINYPILFIATTGSISPTSLLVLSLLLVYLYYLINNWKKIPVLPYKQRISSKEFWMQVRIIVFVCLSFYLIYLSQIIGSSELADTSAHSVVLICITIVLLIVSTIGALLRYNQLFWQSHNGFFSKYLAVCICLTLIVSLFIYSGLLDFDWPIVALIFLCILSIIANGLALIFSQNIRPRIWTFLSHTGLALMIISLIPSISPKKIVNKQIHRDKIHLSDQDNNENSLLRRSEPTHIGPYEVTYNGSQLLDNKRVFDLFFKMAGNNTTAGDQFSLHPSIRYDDSQENVIASCSDIKSYWTKDIHAHILQVSPKPLDNSEKSVLEESTTKDSISIKVGESLRSGDYSYVLDTMTGDVQHEDYIPESADIGFTAIVFISSSLGQTDTLNISSVIRNDYIYQYGQKSKLTGLYIQMTDDFVQNYALDQMTQQTHLLTFAVGEKKIWNDFEFLFNGFNNQPEIEDYQAMEEDILVSAKLDVIQHGTLVSRVEPAYLIRENQGIPIPIFESASNLFVSFEKIDPVNEKVHIRLGKKNIKPPSIIKLLLTDDTPKNDFIVIKTVIVDGIRLFWLGSIFMLIGLFGACAALGIQIYSLDEF